MPKTSSNGGIGTALNTSFRCKKKRRFKMTNQSEVAGKHPVRKLFAIVIAVIVFITVFTNTAFADSSAEYKLAVLDGITEIAITTNETEPIEILKTAGIAVSAEDKINLAGFVKGEGGEIVINRLKNINIDNGSEIKDYKVYASTVSDALSETGTTLGEYDRINFELTEAVQEGMVIEIKKAFGITVKADGNTSSHYVVDGNVSDALELAGVTLGDEDYTKPSLDTPLSADMVIKVKRVTYGEDVKTEPVKFETEEVKDDTLYEGTKEVKTKGVDGVKQLTYTVKYVNGKEKERTLTAEAVTTAPVNEVVHIGTKKKPAEEAVKSNGVTSKNGYKVGQEISGRYTHYCACAKCNGNSRGITSSGKKISNGMKNPHYIACNWLPMGSVISVNGTNYTVVDRGGRGLSKTGRIDIFTPEGHAACMRKGTGSCKIKIVRLGW